MSDAGIVTDLRHGKEEINTKETRVTNQEELQQVMDKAICLYTEAHVEHVLDQMALQITASLSGLTPLVLCVMTGGLVVTGKLVTRLQFPLELDYLHATRYRGELTGADLLWKVHPSTPLEGRHVLIVDDILDEGETLGRIHQYCQEQKAASVRTAVLVDKQHDRRSDLMPVADFTGLYADDRYLFGYGMDYKGFWRNAPGIFAI
jgi:hypoxanthine phosphoribosyltransferase